MDIVANTKEKTHMKWEWTCSWEQEYVTNMRLWLQIYVTLVHAFSNFPTFKSNK
jgi:hypothetical protein